MVPAEALCLQVLLPPLGVPPTLAPAMPVSHSQDRAVWRVVSKCHTGPRAFRITECYPSEVHSTSGHFAFLGEINEGGLARWSVGRAARSLVWQGRTCGTSEAPPRATLWYRSLPPWPGAQDMLLCAVLLPCIRGVPIKVDCWRKGQGGHAHCSRFGDKTVHIACPEAVGRRLLANEWDGCLSAHKCCFCSLAPPPLPAPAMLHIQSLSDGGYLEGALHHHSCARGGRNMPLVSVCLDWLQIDIGWWFNNGGWRLTVGAWRLTDSGWWVTSNERGCRVICGGCGCH